MDENSKKKGYELMRNVRNPLFFLEPSAGVEPATYSLRVFEKVYLVAFGELL